MMSDERGLIRVILKSGKDRSVRKCHPWIFSGAIKKIKGEPANGDLVDVYDNKEEFLCVGHFQHGTIAVRALSFEEIMIDEAFFLDRLKKAWEFRKTYCNFNQSGTNVYRLVNAEGDGLPGLIIDYYNGTAVVQMHSIGMYIMKDTIASGLQQLLDNELKTIYNKSDATVSAATGFETKNEYLFGKKSECIVLENGNRFQIDWEEGQKTGFFIDQRENRRMLGEYSNKKRVLNMFCYTGGFSVYAIQGGAVSVHSVDSSQKAMDLTDKNIELNFPGCELHQSITEDGFDYLDNIENQYDVIILDPPAFAKHQRSLHNALQGYKRINAKAISQIAPGGILFTFTCSQVVSREQFRQVVLAAAASTGRNVKIMHHLSQPTDHPISLYHPEGEYLKGIILYVE